MEELVILRLILLGLSHSCESALNLVQMAFFIAANFRLKRLSLETSLFSQHSRDIVHVFSYKRPGRTWKKP